LIWREYSTIISQFFRYNHLQLHTEKYILYVNNNCVLCISKIHIFANLSQVYHKHQIYSKHSENPNKFNISIEIIKLKVRFAL